MRVTSNVLGSTHSGRILPEYMVHSRVVYKGRPNLIGLFDQRFIHHVDKELNLRVLAIPHCLLKKLKRRSHRGPLGLGLEICAGISVIPSRSEREPTSTAMMFSGI